LDFTKREIEDICNIFAVGNNVDYIKFINAVQPQQSTKKPRIDQILTPISEYLRQNRIALRSQIINFESDGSGEVVLSVIQAALNKVGIRLQQNELQAIKEEFGTKRPDFVKWELFCDAVDPIITTLSPVTKGKTNEHARGFDNTDIRAVPDLAAKNNFMKKRHDTLTIFERNSKIPNEIEFSIIFSLSNLNGYAILI
jgi:hypothetical protein